MATILQPIDFTDVDSKDCVSGDNSKYYKPFVTSSIALVAVKGDILTGSVSGAKIKVLKNLETNAFELNAKVMWGDPDEGGEDWENESAQVVCTGSGGVDEGRNVYLNIGDEYYDNILRDFDILPTDTDLSSPPIFKVKKVLICYVEVEIFQDLLEDSRAPFEGQQVLTEKFSKKLKEAKECHDKWYSKLDENAFYDEPKSTDSTVVGYFGRG